MGCSTEMVLNEFMEHPPFISKMSSPSLSLSYLKSLASLIIHSFHAMSKRVVGSFVSHPSSTSTLKKVH